jgi:hypothetical protein
LGLEIGQSSAGGSEGWGQTDNAQHALVGQGEEKIEQKVSSQEDELGFGGYMIFGSDGGR